MTLEREVASHHLVDVAGDSRFQRRARLLQALWLEEHGWPIGRHVTVHPGTKKPIAYELGSRLKMPDAQAQLWNFITPGVRDLARHEFDSNAILTGSDHKLIGYPRFFDDLLSSQPMCLNLFGELKLDLDLASRVASTLG